MMMINKTTGSGFNESEWLKLLFLLADTQQWLDEMSREIFLQVPLDNKKQFFRKNYFLSVTALVHIIERHYYKIPRHPQTGKFHIPLPEILHHIREGMSLIPTPVSGSLNFQRIVQAEESVGFDKNGDSTDKITILTDGGGRIITAFPGVCNGQKSE